MSTDRNDQYFVRLDSYLGIDRMQELDGILRATLEEFQSNPEKLTAQFLAGERLDPSAPAKIGTKAINLTRQMSGGYYQIDDASCWEENTVASEFPELMDFIRDLPFVSFGRAFIIFDYDGMLELPHRDHNDPQLNQEFIWFRSNPDKKFYIYDKKNKQKHYVDSYSCWFDTRHYHGTDPIEGLSLSIRVDGIFTEEMRQIVLQHQALVPPQGLSVGEKIYRRLYNTIRKFDKPSPEDAHAP